MRQMAGPPLNGAISLVQTQEPETGSGGGGWGQMQVPKGTLPPRTHSQESGTKLCSLNSASENKCFLRQSTILLPAPRSHPGQLLRSLYVYVQLVHFVIRQKPTHHREAIILQERRLKNIIN